MPSTVQTWVPQVSMQVLLCTQVAQVAAARWMYLPMYRMYLLRWQIASADCGTYQQCNSRYKTSYCPSDESII